MALPKIGKTRQSHAYLWKLTIYSHIICDLLLSPLISDANEQAQMLFII